MGDTQRTYLIHTPAGLVTGKPVPLVPAFHGYPNDGTTSTLIEYAGPVPVQLIRIENGGHEWPNFLPHPQDREWLGHMSRDFDASELIWQFFSRFRCPVAEIK